MSRRPRKHHVQLTLDQARKPDGRHGGWRPGAGRPRKQGAVSHDTRPDEPARFPQHVTLRIADGVPSLARDGVVKVIRTAIRASHKPNDRRARAAAQLSHEPSTDHSRSVEFNVLGNHLHLLAEAHDKRALASGVAGLEVRLARRVNALLGRRGKLFPQRYHARALKTPREVRNCSRTCC